jgi:abortive infection bacteriophage resistance protein
MKSRGLIIADEQKAINYLKVISYFRLANYLRPMEKDKETHLYKPNSYFDNAIDLYYFDKELRSIIFSAVQSIEIALRSKMIHHISLKYGAFWYMDASLFKDDNIFISV